jgi:hypothetical protein
MRHSIQYPLQEHANLLRQHIACGRCQQQPLCLISIQPPGLIRSTLEGQKVCILGQKWIVLTTATNDKVHSVAKKKERGACRNRLCPYDAAPAGDTLAERIKSRV